MWVPDEGYSINIQLPYDHDHDGVCVCLCGCWCWCVCVGGIDFASVSTIVDMILELFRKCGNLLSFYYYIIVVLYTHGQ